MDSARLIDLDEESFLARPVGDALTVPTPEWLAAAGILHAVIHIFLRFVDRFE